MYLFILPYCAPQTVEWILTPHTLFDSSLNRLTSIGISMIHLRFVYCIGLRGEQFAMPSRDNMLNACTSILCAITVIMSLAYGWRDTYVAHDALSFFILWICVSVNGIATEPVRYRLVD